MPTSVDGLISGLSSTDTIASLMSVERLSQNRLAAKKSSVESIISSYQTLNSRLLSVKDVSAGVKSTASWQLTSASSSNPAIATVSALGSALAGSLQFRVTQLASTETLVSAGTASLSTIVATPDSHYLVSAASSLGFSQLTGSSDLALGAHTVAVTQASAGASQSGTALGTSITIAGSSTLEVALDGSTTTTMTLNLAAGTYTRAQLADQVASASGGELSASFANDGTMTLSTTREGSAAQLAITGGTSLATLGLSVSASASTGTNGIVTVDGNATTVRDIAVGGSTTFDLTAGGSITGSFGGGLRVGSVNTKNVDLGDGKLSTVVAAVNGAAAGIQWLPVQIGAGVYKLQVSSTTPGVNGRNTSDLSIFATSMGGMQTLSSAADAKLTVGTGPAAYTITSSTNKAELLPGVTVNLVSADPSATVIVSVASDSNAVANKVGNLVDTLNSAFAFISSQTKYDTSTKKGGTLLGDSTTRNVQRQMFDAISATDGVAGTYGITVTKEGTFEFDRAKFLAAYQADPAATQEAFTNATTGIATRFERVGINATDASIGSVTVAITGKKTLTKTLTDQISGWDTRLSLREASLKRMFSNLEVSLGKMKSQSSWLSGQINSLPTNS